MVARPRLGVVGGRFPAPRPIQGLTGEVGRLVWLGLPLEDGQASACWRAGVSFTDPHEGGWSEEPHADARLLIRADVALTAAAVEAFCEAMAGREGDGRWSLGGRAGNLAHEVGFGRDEALLVWLAPGGAVTPERVAAAPLVEIEPAERMLQVPLGTGDLLELPLTDRLVLPAGHWLQLLWANLLGLAPFLWRQLAGRNIVELAWRVGLAAMGALSVDPIRVGARLGRRGRGVRIHPSAVVEGCWLGDGVEIGANAVVRASVLGAGAAVEDLAIVEGAVLGAGARVQRQALVKYSVLQPRASAAGVMQLGVLDRDAALKATAVLMDQALGQSVRVLDDGRLVKAPLGLAGCCVGAAAVVGAGVQVAPGRVVPPGLRVVSEPGSLLRSIPEGLDGLVTVRGGTLVSLDGDTT